MSLCIALISLDNVFISADTAVSTMVDNNLYRVHDQGKKIWNVGNQVIFCSGKMDLKP